MVKNILILIYFFSFSTFAESLLIESKSQNKAYTSKSLLNHKQTKTISIPKDPSYGNVPATLQVIPLHELFKDLNISNEQVIQFHCADGFSAPLNTILALNNKKDKAIAYLAIEDPQNKWSPLPKKEQSAGPFRIVWVNPEKSNIVQEQWPYMITSFSIKESLQSAYPKIYPNKNLKENDPVKKGFKVFLTNCFACHKMNQQGEGEIGPDLNHPMNPTEYFKESALRKLIRNPRSVRAWKGSLMPDFDKEEISDKELNELIAYLKHMTSRKN